ncbi:MAG: hypothetical protein CSA58_11320 [Micrococcales bacterium]|nr:MAG: hypothetical protein CSA58_11320 [Micrococcales bacterium]
MQAGPQVRGKQHRQGPGGSPAEGPPPGTGVHPQRQQQAQPGHPVGQLGAQGGGSRRTGHRRVAHRRPRGEQHEGNSDQVDMGAEQSYPDHQRVQRPGDHDAGPLDAAGRHPVCQHSHQQVAAGTHQLPPPHRAPDAVAAGGGGQGVQRGTDRAVDADGVRPRRLGRGQHRVRPPGPGLRRLGVGVPAECLDPPVRRIGQVVGGAEGGHDQPGAGHGQGCTGHRPSGQLPNRPQPDDQPGSAEKVASPQ